MICYATIKSLKSNEILYQMACIFQAMRGELINLLITIRLTGVRDISYPQRKES